MNIFQTLHQSPKHQNKFHSPRGESPQVGSYEEYFQRKLKQDFEDIDFRHKQSQRRKQNQASGTSKTLKSKNKLSKIKEQKPRQQAKKVKKSKQSYTIDPMYASRISQMLSEISVPKQQARVTKQQLRKLQSKIISEILSLRQQKILALQGLNKVMDKKNKAVQLIKNYEVLKESQRLNTDDDSEDEDEVKRDLSRLKLKDSRTIGNQYKSGSNNNQYNSNNQYTNNNQYNTNSHVSKRSQTANQLINSKIQRQTHMLQNTSTQVGKIKQQLMKPLIEHPLVLRSKQLQEQLQQLQQQLQQCQGGKLHMHEQIDFYKSQNQKLTKQLQKQRNKLASIQHKRFETFFPKDKLRMEQMHKMLEVEQILQQKKEDLHYQLMNGTIIRKAEDQIMIQELRQENKQLLNNCELLLSQGHQQENNQYYSMSVEQLQNHIEKQLGNKRVLATLLTQFKNKIQNMEKQNDALKRKQTRVSYYY